MRILLRDQITGLFYLGRGNWTPRKAQAHDFPSWDDVFRVARRYELAKGEMLFDFADPDVSFSIPVGGAGASSWSSFPHEATDPRDQPSHAEKVCDGVVQFPAQLCTDLVFPKAEDR